MTRLPSSLFWLIAPAALGLWLLVAIPSRWHGIDTGALGAGVLLAVAAAGLWFASRIPDDGASTLSPGEQKRWVALAFTGLIGGLMLFNAGIFAGARTMAELENIGRPIAMLLVGWLIFGSVLRQRFGSAVQEDERDTEVVRAADDASQVALYLAVIAVAVTLGLTPPARLAWASPIAIANLLMFALVFAGFVGHVVALRRYRRDRA
ncbi:hypothetical protein [Dokdonella koreensis]|uniref:Uncharacterized protein n=1 Tax=Dokdonella koreensis DS-123 TaxID=1300342 RepID=A0A160DUD8_9GAMM|nr:hypothetical protein [Dokdonella koreensis]ANB18078.1 Hypothetical protein I596_2059 [Dokdonella koreensis DS-123]